MNRNQARFLRLIKGVQEKYLEPIYEALRDQINYFADGYEKGEERWDLPTKPLIKALRELHEAAGVPNAIYVRKQLKRQMFKSNETPNQRIRWMINEYYRLYLLNQAVVPITKTTVKQIHNILQIANQNGWGVDKTVSALRHTDITRQRAELIVRTETMKAANAGAMIGAAEVGFMVQKEWLSAQDNRTRRIPRDQYDHLHMRGIRVGFTERFIVPSTKSIDAMLYPGDPEGSAGNVCNCRCTLAFIPMRDSTGQLIPMQPTTPTGSGNPADIFIQLAQQSRTTLISVALVSALIQQIEDTQTEKEPE